jgi:hypothetical protein
VATRAPGHGVPCSFKVDSVSLPRASSAPLPWTPSSPPSSHRSRVGEALAAGSSPQAGDPAW